MRKFSTSRITRVVLALPLVIVACLIWRQLPSPTHAQSSPSPKRRMNVLFIAVDDLRPLGASYGTPQVKTPHMDALARRGVVFERAYCQQAVCSPSRTSLLTGLRPDTTRIYDLRTHFRSTLPEIVTLPEHFKQHGYHTQAFGKIFHMELDDPQSWSAPTFPAVPQERWRKGELPRPSARRLDDPLEGTKTVAGKLHTPQVRDSHDSSAVQQNSQNKKQAGSQPDAPIRERKGQEPLDDIGLPIYKVEQKSWAAPDVPDAELLDGQVADKAIATMSQIKDKPFFLGVGFYKPHLPFIAPKKDYDMYPPEKITLAPNSFPPQNVPEIALANWGELRRYEDIPLEGPVSDEKARELVRGYYAATSFADRQIGRVIDALDRLGLRDNTIIVLWGDHGFQLGEHGLWCKHTNFEVATRSPLIVSVPGRKAAGVKTKALIEFVDIYPTLSDLAGLPMAQNLEGKSFAPLLDDPALPWKQAAFSQFPRLGGYMGYSIRTDRYRYTEWIKISTKAVAATELYDHRVDAGENVNIADRAGNKNIIRELSKKLHASFQDLLPLDRTSNVREKERTTKGRGIQP